MTLPLLKEQGGALSGLVQGVGQGLQQAMPSISEMILSNQMQRQKQQQIQSILGPSPQASQGMPDLGMQSDPMQGLDITPEKIVAMSQIDPQVASNMARIYQGQEKQRMKKQEKAEAIKPAIDALDEMESLIKKKGIGFVGNYLNQSGEARKNRGRFSSLQASILPVFKSLFPRGMTEKEFKYIQENYIPQVSDTEATIKGKIQGLRQLVSGEKQLDLSGMKKESSKDFVMMKDPEGNVRKIPKNMAIQAQKSGGVLVK